MIRNVIIAALAGSAAIAAPAIAKPGAGASVNTNAGVHANTNAGANARVNSQGSVNASTNAHTNANVNSAVNANTSVNPNTNVSAGANARVNSQGAAKASTQGLVHANGNSAVAKGSVQADALPGLSTGLTVKDSAGASIGSVNQVVTGTDGSIRAVVVTKTDGTTVRLMPNTLTINGGVVTTTTVTGG